MNVHFLILKKDTSTTAVDSIKAAGYTDKEYTELDVKTNVQGTINKAVEKLKTKSTHICIIPSSATIADNFKAIIDTYNVVTPENIDEEFYLPLVELTEKNDKGEKSFKGFLNKCVWHPYFANVLGEMDHDLALKQADTHLYGALIPVSKVKDISLREDIKHYWFFEYFNRVTKDDVTIIKGLPKILLTLEEDYQLKDVSQEEKVADFKLASVGYGAE